MPSSPPGGMDPVTVLQQDNYKVREVLRKVQAEMEEKEEKIKQLEKVYAELQSVVMEKDGHIDSLTKEVLMLRGEVKTHHVC